MWCMQVSLVLYARKTTFGHFWHSPVVVGDSKPSLQKAQIGPARFPGDDDDDDDDDDREDEEKKRKMKPSRR